MCVLVHKCMWTDWHRTQFLSLSTCHHSKPVRSPRFATWLVGLILIYFTDPMLKALVSLLSRWSTKARYKIVIFKCDQCVHLPRPYRKWAEIKICSWTEHVCTCIYDGHSCCVKIAKFGQWVKLRILLPNPLVYTILMMQNHYYIPSSNLLFVVIR